MQNLKEFISKYKKYILIMIIILLIIIVGFIYSNQTTIKYEEKESQINIDEKKQEKKINLIKVDIKGSIKNPGVYEMNENDRINDVISKAGGLEESANTNYLNLSKKIKDEMVIIIYSDDEIKEFEKTLEANKNDKKEIIKYEIIEKEIPCPNTTNNACINKLNTSNTKETKQDAKTSDLEKIDEEKTSDIEKTTIEENNNDDLININYASKEQLMTLPGIGESKAELIIDYRNNELFKDINDIKNVKGIGESLFEKIKDYITI